MAPLTAPPVPAYLLRKEGAPLRATAAAPGSGAPGVGGGGGAAPVSFLTSGITLLNYLRGVASGNVPAAIMIFSTIFLLKIALCIPGGTLLNAMGGALFGLPLGLPLVLVLSVVGSCGAFLLSQTCGGALLVRCRLEARLAPLRRRLEAASAAGTLPRLLTSMRMLPLFPQWLINVGAPHLGISMHLFASTTALGLIPYVSVCVASGAALSSALDAAAAAGDGGKAGGAVTFASLVPPHVLAVLCTLALAVGLGPTLLQRACGCALAPESAAAASSKDSSDVSNV